MIIRNLDPQNVLCLRHFFFKSPVADIYMILKIMLVNVGHEEFHRQEEDQ